MRNKIWILIDNDRKNAYQFLSKISEKIVYSPSSKSNLISWVIGCMRVLWKSKRGDIIVCWFDFQAVLCWCIARLFIMKRQFIAINLMLKEKNTIRNRLVSKLYKCFLESENVKATVTSKFYGIWLKRKLKLKDDVTLTLLHDVYLDDYELDQIECGYHVFCGGTNGRDWTFMLSVAKSTPGVYYEIVMPKDIYDKYNHDYDIPRNVKLYTNLPYKDFLCKMAECGLVCLPLDTEAPAGLIVMFQAAANQRMVITTLTATTQEYVNEHRGLALPRDVDTWSQAIHRMMNDCEERKRRAEAMQVYLKTECSEPRFIETINMLVV